MPTDDYKEWLSLGHQDHPEHNECRVCGIGFEVFQGQRFEDRHTCYGEIEAIKMARNAAANAFHYGFAEKYPESEG